MSKIKIRFWFSFKTVLALVLFSTAGSAQAGFGDYQALSSADLNNLVGPVALYPDPLLAQVLPASTHSDQIEQAARWLQQNSDPSLLAQQQWDPSVIALAHYPSVITMMNNRIAWTMQLGLAFQNQQSDVMKAVQRMRAQAQQQGNLISNSQQQVVVASNTISIVPAVTDVIYVPTYDTTVVYTQPANPYAPAVAFGAGMMLGSWMSSSEVNWNTSTVVYHPPVYGAAYYRGSYGNPAYGTARGYTTSAGGYGGTASWHGTGAYGNQYNGTYTQGRTATGGAYTAQTNTNQWDNGAKTGSFSTTHSGPYSAGTDRGWGYQNGSDQAGGFSKTFATQDGVYHVQGAGAADGSNSAGSITASGVNRDGDYGTKTWSGNDGSWSSAGHSGDAFGGTQSWDSASAASDRGWQSRGGGGFSSGGSFGGGDSFGGGGYRSSGGFGGGGFGGGGFRGGFRR